MQSVRAGLEEALVGSLAEQTKEAGLTAVDVAVFNTAHELTHRMADPDPATTGWGLTEGQMVSDFRRTHLIRDRYGYLRELTHSSCSWCVSKSIAGRFLRRL